MAWPLDVSFRSTSSVMAKPCIIIKCIKWSMHHWSMPRFPHSEWTDRGNRKLHEPGEKVWNGIWESPSTQSPLLTVLIFSARCCSAKA